MSQQFRRMVNSYAAHDGVIRELLWGTHEGCTTSSLLHTPLRLTLTALLHSTLLDPGLCVLNLHH